MNLAGKNVLFIAPMFFGYERLIKAGLESYGASVDYFNDRPDNSFLTKSLIRIDRRLLARKTERYYQGILSAAKCKSYDYVFIVRGEAISISILKGLRRVQPGAKFILYLWDSMHYNPNAKNILHEFDSVLSFDRVDVAKDSRIRFLPLFYSEDFNAVGLSVQDFSYDVCFIGTVHTDRYKVVERIVQTIHEKGKTIFLFCYYPSKLLFLLRSCLDPGFRSFARKYNVKFTGMSLSEVGQRMAQSRAIIDINRPNQLGLTMRTIETVGVRRRLVTTNNDIKNYDIYNENDVLIIDRHHPSIPDGFLEREGIPYDDGIRSRYSLRSWLSAVFS